MAIHCHQPVGNFDHVIRQAADLAYRPFLKVLENHPEIPIALHYSGILYEWFEKHAPDIIDLLRKLSDRNQIEFLGGGFYEPILMMLPERDRLGQMKMQNDYIKDTFARQVRGFWLTERVWEQSIVSSAARAGYQYVTVDDSHFKYAGIPDVKNGYYITEDQSSKLAVFPAKEFLRYAIPFRNPEDSVSFFQNISTEDGAAVVVYADDGEKFGTWPGTHKHVYLDGWLDRFLAALKENASWIKLKKFSDIIDEIPPCRTAYLPDASYREMMEWALPADTLIAHRRLEEKLASCGILDEARYFLKGTFWRSFLAKYPESREMYSKMLITSALVDRAGKKANYRKALRELYQGQCNCSYWHGIFGGLYLPHLRSAVYEHLIKAENLISPRLKTPETAGGDFNFDGKEELLIATNRFNLYIKPHTGGHIYEFDVRNRAFNLGAGLTRRKESYHDEILNPPSPSEHGVKSIHDKLTFKEPGLDKLLFYDWYKRESFVDHFLENSESIENLYSCRFRELGDFVGGSYQTSISKKKGSLELVLFREGAVNLDGRALPLSIKKSIAVESDSDLIEFRFVLENKSDHPISAVFAAEFNFALLAGSAPDRFYWSEKPEESRGPLNSKLALDASDFGLVDRWIGINVSFGFGRTISVWTYPVQTVSQSEAGLEHIYQSSTVLPRWPVNLPPAAHENIDFSLRIIELASPGRRP